MKIAIPTYKRADTIEELSLKIFRKLSYPIYLFVHTEEQKKQYEKIKGVEIVVSNAIGIVGQRNFILNYFKEGEEIVQIDDDIQDIFILKSGYPRGKLEKLEGNQLEGFIEQAFADLKREGLKLWGVYPVPNAFYMDNGMSRNNFVIATFMGIIVSNLRFDSDLILKEDYDFTLQNIMIGGTLRYNFITVKAKHYVNSGGVKEIRDDKNEQKSIAVLKAKWGDWIKNNPRRKNEILIKRKIK